jgi:hypothetical protein
MLVIDQKSKISGAQPASSDSDSDEGSSTESEKARNLQQAAEKKNISSVVPSP